MVPEGGRPAPEALRLAPPRRLGTACRGISPSPQPPAAIALCHGPAASGRIANRSTAHHHRAPRASATTQRTARPTGGRRITKPDRPDPRDAADPPDALDAPARRNTWSERMAASFGPPRSRRKAACDLPYSDAMPCPHDRHPPDGATRSTFTRKDQPATTVRDDSARHQHPA